MQGTAAGARIAATMQDAGQAPRSDAPGHLRRARRQRIAQGINERHRRARLELPRRHEHMDAYHARPSRPAERRHRGRQHRLARAASTPTTPDARLRERLRRQRARLGEHRRSSGGASSPRGPWLSGGFVWTGFDYRGEPTPYDWPCINSHFGILDTCGFPKDNFWYYQSWWTDQPVLHLLPALELAGPAKARRSTCARYSNCDEVELFLNGRSLGRQTDGARFRPEVEGRRTRPARFSAKGYSARQVVAEAKVETTGAPGRRAARARPHRASTPTARTSRVVTVSVVDAQGRVVPTADNADHLRARRPRPHHRRGQRRSRARHEPDIFVAPPTARARADRRLALEEDRRPLRREPARGRRRASTTRAGPDDRRDAARAVPWASASAASSARRSP